jgi:transposase-like protein
MTVKKTAASCSPEVRERSMRLVLDGAGEHGSRWAAIGSIAVKIGCTASRKATPDASANAEGGKGGKTLRRWVRQAEPDRGKRVGPMTEGRDLIKAPGREHGHLRQANEFLRKASAYFALPELDRRSKPRSPSSTIIAVRRGVSRLASGLNHAQ